MDSPDSSSGPLVGGIVGAIIAIIIVVAVVLVLWYVIKREMEKERNIEGIKDREKIFEGRKMYLLICLCSLRYIRTLPHVQPLNNCIIPFTALYKIV